MVKANKDVSPSVIENMMKINRIQGPSLKSSIPISHLSAVYSAVLLADENDDAPPMYLPPLNPREIEFSQLLGWPQADALMRARLRAFERKKQLVLQQPNSNLPIEEQRKSLPIFKFKEQLVQAVHDNQVLVVNGPSGSGKTTQIVQYLAEAGFTAKGKIGCVRPNVKMMDTIWAAKRVAEEFGCRVGQEVGYQDLAGPKTVIKYMNDNMLLRDITDENHLQYSVIVLDEHPMEEAIGNVNKLVLTYLKRLLQERPELRLIVTCYTEEAEAELSGYFSNSSIITIPSKRFPVEILYTKEPETDHVEAAVTTVLQMPPSTSTQQQGVEQVNIETASDQMKAIGIE